MGTQPMDDFFKNRQLAEENKKKNAQIYQDFSKKKLMGSVKTKIKTTMIGAIAEFEKSFGHFWGIGQDEASLTPEQLKLRDEWNKVRTKILNVGNNQIRNSEEEISQYELNRKKDTLTFVIKGDAQNG